LFFRTVNAYQETAALRAAIELELFTAIGEDHGTVEAIADRVGASRKGVRILCDYLTVLGFLRKDTGAYRLTEDSAVFLDKRSPAYCGATIDFLLSPTLVGGFDDLTATVRNGGAAAGTGTMEPNHPIWREFARSMVPLMTLPAETIARRLGADSGRPWKVLDIAAGHGLFGISIAKLNPNAEITAVDWAPVLELAREHAVAAGVGSRFHTLAGSAFEVDFGAGYDVALLTNFLHHFDPPTCEKLLGKVCAALKPGGRAATLEFVPNDDRVTPPVAATFSMIMLGSTERGDAYTFAELERMFAGAGFGRSELQEMEPTPQRLVISYR
jgi:SAM-dependent methyltransferase